MKKPKKSTFFGEALTIRGQPPKNFKPLDLPQPMRKKLDHLEQEFHLLQGRGVAAFGRGRSLQNAPLLLGSLEPEILSIAQALKETHKQFILIDWDQIVKDGHFLSIVGSKFKSTTLSGNGSDWTFGNHRRNVYFSLPESLHLLTENPLRLNSVDLIHLNRWRQSLVSIESLNHDLQWIPQSPSRGLLPQNKLSDLAIARESGFNIPETLFTNSSNVVMDWQRKTKSDILVRDFSQRIFGHRRTPHVLPILPLISSKLRSLFTKEPLSISPVIFQEFIPAQYDWRVVVVLDKVFSFRIQREAPNFDWRTVPPSSLKVEWKKLPQTLHKNILRMRTKTQTQFGTLDLLEHFPSKATQQKFTFLEMNRPGRWLFLEMLTGAPISQTLARALTKKI